MTFEELPDNIKKNINFLNNHWIWTGAQTNRTRQDVKGRVRFNGKNEYAHRVILHLFTGFDLDGPLQANHKQECPISLCINPEHLYAGTQKDNVKDSIELGTNKELLKTHCPQGHEYSVSPTTGHRYCQTCKNKRRDEWRKRQ